MLQALLSFMYLLPPQKNAPGPPGRARVFAAGRRFAGRSATASLTGSGGAAWEILASSIPQVFIIQMNGPISKWVDSIIKMNEISIKWTDSIMNMKRLVDFRQLASPAECPLR